MISGFWADDVAKLAGYKLPLITLHHEYFLTSSLPEIEELQHNMPVLRHMEGSSYIRAENNGILIGSFEEAHLVKTMDNWLDNGVPGSKN